jgi:hypothetical protein
MPMGRHTDLTKEIVTFRNFVKAPQKQCNRVVKTLSSENQQVAALIKNSIRLTGHLKEFRHSYHSDNEEHWLLASND